MGNTHSDQINAGLEQAGITDADRLPQASRKLLERLAKAPVPRSLVNPGPRDLLVKRGLVSVRRIEMRSPKGDVCLTAHLVITDTGKAWLANL